MENIQNHLVSLLFILSFETDFPTKGVKTGERRRINKKGIGRRRHVIASIKERREAQDHGGATLLYHTRSAYLESGGKKWNTVIKGGGGEGFVI